jgi:muskelin
MYGLFSYRFGGFDGTDNLSDLWSYSLSTNIWTLLSADTFASGGPSARSTHRMVFVQSTGEVYLTGKLLEPVHPELEDQEDGQTNDFWVLRTRGVRKYEWEKLSDDTKKDGGPGIISDHQLCIDEKMKVIYLFGGKGGTAGRGLYW